jgi:hypothetical protein
MSTVTLPVFLKPFFWSYRFEELNTHTHQSLIIKQVLNHGSKEALDWLFSVYTSEQIKVVLANSIVSEWNKKSLSLWSKVFGVVPTRQSRFV